MKYFYFFLFLGAVLFSCKKPASPTCTDGELNQQESYTDCGGPCSACPITYPEFGSIGRNLLFEEQDTLNLVASNYSFKADVPSGSSLKVVATTITGDYWLYGINNGWAVSTPTTSQSFSVNVIGTADMVFNISGSNGTALLEVYENSESVTRQMVIVWN